MSGSVLLIGLWRVRGEGAIPAVKGGYNLIRVLLSDVAKLFPPIPTVDPDDYARW